MTDVLGSRYSTSDKTSRDRLTCCLACSEAMKTCARLAIVVMASVILLGTTSPVQAQRPPRPLATGHQGAPIKVVRADEVSVGDSAKAVQVEQLNGETASLFEEDGAPATVVIFMSTDCPIGNLYVPELNRLHDDFVDKGVQVIGVYANSGVSREDAIRHQEEFEIKFPLYFDERQHSVDSLGATRTPDAVLLDQNNVLRYRGRIDNRIGYSFKQKEAERSDLREAIHEVLDGKTVSIAETETLGCLITRRERSTTELVPITFANQVSRIVQKNCADCHHPGTAAPFSLETYDDVADHAEMIKEVIIERRMPPWHADPAYGHFSNDLRLAQEDIDTLVAWVNAGMPEGDSSMLPEPVEHASGWMIDEPDIVWEMPESFDVQAEGVVEYQYWRIPEKLKEDIWIKAAEARPGNRAVVHHIILYALTKDEDGETNRELIVGTAPGEEPIILPEGMGIRIPAGAQLMWELHYTPIGRAATDRSSVGLVLCDEPPEREVHLEMAINRDFSIPPRDGNAEVKAQKRIRHDVELITLMPHMHLRGKDFKYVAKFPDGTEETLLSIPNYDFNWQHTYRFAEPKFIPKGTVIECTAHFDNSEQNPANPNPDETVGWGEQTFEEMMIGFMKFVEVDDR